MHWLVQKLAPEADAVHISVNYCAGLLRNA